MTGVAGCLSVLDDEPPVIDVDSEGLASIAERDAPSRLDSLPITVTDEYVASGRERVEELLDPIPASVAEEIPNEAVAEYIADARDTTRDRLDGLAEAVSNYDRIGSLRSARREAGTAAGAYAVVQGDRTPADAFEDLDHAETRLSALRDGLTRTGDDPERAVRVYAAIERRLGGAENHLETASRTPTAMAEVERVGETDGRVEWARASLDDAEHLLARQAAEMTAQNDDRSFDETFRTGARALLEDAEADLDALPDELGDASTVLFESPVEDTPRDMVGADAVRSAYASEGRVEDHLAVEEYARAFEFATRLGHALETIDRLQVLVDEEDGLQRPADLEGVSTAREEAIDAVETIRAEIDTEILPGWVLDAAVDRIGRADLTLERDAERNPERAAVRAVGEYGFATQRARAVPAAVERARRELA